MLDGTNCVLRNPIRTYVGLRYWISVYDFSPYLYAHYPSQFFFFSVNHDQSQFIIKLSAFLCKRSSYSIAVFFIFFMKGNFQLSHVQTNYGRWYSIAVSFIFFMKGNLQLSRVHTNYVITLFSGTRNMIFGPYYTIVNL